MKMEREAPMPKACSLEAGNLGSGSSESPRPGDIAPTLLG